MTAEALATPHRHAAPRREAKLARARRGLAPAPAPAVRRQLFCYFTVPLLVTEVTKGGAAKKQLVAPGVRTHDLSFSTLESWAVPRGRLWENRTFGEACRTLSRSHTKSLEE
jgi:hypothetical protein